jgi:hypothetical protein
MKGWLLVLLFAAGCSPQYTREQAKNCAAAESAGTAFWGSVAEDAPTHTRETALAALPVLIDRLKSFPPGSAGADEEIKGLSSSATDLQAKVPSLSPTATKEDIATMFSGVLLWYNALIRRCQEIDQRLAAPSVPSPAPFPAGRAAPSLSEVSVA